MIGIRVARLHQRPEYTNAVILLQPIGLPGARDKEIQFSRRQFFPKL